MLVFYLLIIIISVSAENSTREAKDLVYEAMKMRTGTWRPWDRDRVEIVGGGILEKKMLGSLDNGGIEDREGMFHESRGWFGTFQLNHATSQYVFFQRCNAATS